ncbi:MAG: translocation/assembly module TamB domain-containing protein [Bacteroidales bacterium]
MELTPRLRRLGLAAAAALAAVLALVAGLFAFVHTGPGERWVSGKIEENVAGLELDGFHLGWPFRMRADTVRLMDSHGAWAEARGFELVWHPLRLWRRVLDVDRLVARRVDVYRLPQIVADTTETRPTRLPETVRLDEVNLPVVLAAPVLGQTLALELTGTARMAGGGGPVEMSLRATNGDFVRITGIAGTDYLDLRWYLHLPDLRRWRQLAGTDMAGTVNGSGVVAGRLPSPEISGRLDMGSGAVAQARWSALGVTARAQPDGDRWHLALQGDIATPSWQGAALPVASTSLSLMGDLAPAQGRLRLGYGKLFSPRGIVEASGLVEDWGRHAVLRLHGRAPALNGVVRARGIVAGDLTSAHLDGRLALDRRGPATGIAVLDRLLGPRPQATLALAVRGGRVLLGPSRLAGAAASLTASGVVAPRLDLWARLALPDAGVPIPNIAGTATAFAHVGGAVDAPTLAGVAVLDGIRIGTAPPGAGIVAFDLPEPARPRGHLSASLSIADTALAAQARLERGRGVRLDDLVLAAGPSQVRGAVEFDNGVRGRLSGTIPQLQQWQEVLGRPLSGRVEAEAVLDPRRGQQLRLTAQAHAVTVDGVAIPAAAIDVEAEGLSTDRRRLTVHQASANPAGIPLELLEAARLDWRGDSVALAPTRLKLGSGRAELSGRLDGGALDGHARLDALPLGVVAPGTAGMLNGTIDAAGTLTTPRLRFALTGRNLALAQAEQAGLGRLTAQAEGSWQDGHLAGRIGISDGSALRVNADGGVDLPGGGGLSVRLHANGDAGRLADALPLGAHVISGSLEAAATASGSLDAPRLDGHAVLRGGRYENLDSGTVVTALKAEALLRGERVELTASGSDGGDGSVRLRGDATLAGDYDADIVLERFAALRRDDVEAAVDGTLRLAEGRLAGELTVPRAEIDVGRIKGGGPVHLEVVEINRPNAPSPPRQQRQKSAVTEAALALDVHSRIEHAFVRGRGLDSEWQGDVAVAGTTAAPSLTGKLTATRGQLDLLGKSFKLTGDSTVTFQGDTPPDPALAVTAEAAAADITAQVQVTGTAKAPEMAFTSSPPLPQDEVLARLLFGREAGKLSAFQQIQLAQMAASGLTGDGGGFDPVGELRGFLGLDVLGFGSETDRSGKESPTVSAGRYVGRDTFVRVDQGTAGLGRVTVEQGVGGGFSVESYVGEQAGGGVGLSWRKDY